MQTLFVTLVVGIVLHATSALAHHRFTRHAFIRVGQNGYRVTSVYGCVMEDAQGAYSGLQLRKLNHWTGPIIVVSALVKYLANV